MLSHGLLRKIIDGKVGLQLPLSNGFNGRSVQALLEDNQGVVWIGTRAQGVHRLRLPDGKSEAVFEIPEDAGVMLQDGDGNIWIGSNGHGLLRVRGGTVRRFDKEHGLLERHTLGIAEDNAHTIWIANRDGGLAYINEQRRVRTLAAPKGRDTFSARSLAPFGSEGVLVTTSFGLLRATRDGFLPPDAPSAPPPPPGIVGEMRVTYLAKNGDFWAVLQPGALGRLRNGAWQVFDFNAGLTHGRVQAISEDSQGQLWIGTETSHLFRFENERLVPAPLPIEAPVQSIHFDPTGTGWIGTATAGVLQIGSPPGRQLGERHGLPSNNIGQVLSDHLGNLWFGSPKGIFKVARAELDQFFSGKIDRVDATQLTSDEGVNEAIGAVAHQPSAWKSHDDVLWFATRQGVIAVDPRREHVATTPLLARVETARTEHRGLPATASIEVPALSRALTLEYSVLCLSNPDRVRARFRLEGYEDNWTPVDARGLAHYTRLPPGEYTFVLNAHLSGVAGSASEIRQPIIVLAAWWQTLLFRLGIIALILLLGVLAARAWSHRRLRAKLAKLESETALERERTRIARNLHDDLGAGLTRISLLTQTASQHNKAGQLDRIYSAVSELTQSMDAIVWAVNPQHDDLESVANYIVEFAQGFLADAGLRARVVLPDYLPHYTLTAQHRHHLFLSCKEALNNCVKHAQATEISLAFTVENNRLQIVITDNGRGFPSSPPESPRGNGLANLRARMADLGGTCEISVAPSGGTALTFDVPLPTATPTL
ncbi:two-component regulator propeller domain-containing protein [Oleiharenicola lentus]|uniref:sensor histidine kinase n=1 Tax=Oleiharenicola lentus TaxID=2508720 RepID=UPI003F66DC9C